MYFNSNHTGTLNLLIHQTILTHSVTHSVLSVYFTNKCSGSQLFPRACAALVETMAVVMKPKYGKVPNENESNDITTDLPSLQFESALSEEENELLVLRDRSHALTVSACAQATYFVSVLNEAR